MASSSRNPRSRSSSTGSHHRRSDEGSDSEATRYVQPPPISVAPPAWFPDHPWLHFPTEAEFDSPNVLYSRVSMLRNRQPCAVRFLDLGDPILRELLGLVGDYLHYRVEDPFGNLVFSDPSLGSLVSIAEPSFPVLWLEFFASYEVNPSSTDFGNARYITFRLGGERRYCSLYDFGERLGLYSPALATSFAFQEYLRSGAVIQPQGFQPAAFWSEIADGDFNSEVVVSSIRSVTHRFLARYSITYPPPYSFIYFFLYSNICSTLSLQAHQLVHPSPQGGRQGELRWCLLLVVLHHSAAGEPSYGTGGPASQPWRWHSPHQSHPRDPPDHGLGPLLPDPSRLPPRYEHRACLSAVSPPAEQPPRSPGERSLGHWSASSCSCGFLR